MDALDAIGRRTSVRTFTQEAVPRDVMARLLDAAVRAPNHKLTEPWRFVVVTGSAKERYAQIRRAHRAEKIGDAPDAAAKVEKTYREHADTPAFVFVLQELTADPIRREEDYAAVMMAMQNLMIAATALGLGTNVRTGGIMDRDDVRGLIGATANQRIVGIVAVGRPTEDAPPTRRAPSAGKTVWLD
jgi:nitroreductase